MRYGRLSELLKLVVQMQGRADGISLEDIALECSVSRRTAERMRDALLDAFPQIEEVANLGPQKRWRMPSRGLGRMIEPSVNDLVALNRGSEIAEQSGDLETADTIREVSDRLRAYLATANKNRMEPDIAILMEADGVARRPGPREQISKETLHLLRQAILAGSWVRADHRSRISGKVSRNTRIGPIAVLFGEGRQYLVGWSEWADDVRLYSLSGFEAIRVEQDQFVQPENFELDEYLNRSFGIFQDAVYNVVWRFTPKVSAVAQEFLFHPTQKSVVQEDGSLLVSFEACGLREMAWHLVRWGDQVEILEPNELKDLYKELISSIAQSLSKSVGEEGS